MRPETRCSNSSGAVSFGSATRPDFMVSSPTEASVWSVRAFGVKAVTGEGCHSNSGVFNCLVLLNISFTEWL